MEVPVIQNEKFAGAVTHVFVQDSTSGYGIFAETMLENSGKNAAMRVDIEINCLQNRAEK